MRTNNKPRTSRPDSPRTSAGSAVGSRRCCVASPPDVSPPHTRAGPAVGTWTAPSRSRRGLSHCVGSVCSIPGPLVWLTKLLPIGLVAIGALCGCRQIETRFDVTSFKNPGNPEQFTERFPPGAFSVDVRHNWEIAFDIPNTTIKVLEPLEVDAAGAHSREGEAPAMRARTVSMSQYVHLRVFWKPKPGTTYAESTQTNAGILYCLVTGNNAISYEGAGFVYFTLSRDKQTITGRIESSTLVPVRTAKAPVDLFGPCRVEGWFIARQDRPRVVEIQQRVRRVLGGPGLALTGTDAAPTAE